jgi:predicted site-specific integrase-resolvase
MTILSISAAAQTAGIDRRTLQRAIKSGRVSATVDATGRRGVDVAELLRV